MTDEELIARLRDVYIENTIRLTAADRIEALKAKLAAAVEALKECQEELDRYSWQEYPSGHPVHERYRKRDFDANPARIALAEIEPITQEGSNN